MADTGLISTRPSVEHRVLHDIIDHAHRGVDHRPISDIATSLSDLTWDAVVDAYHDLVDQGALEITSTRKGAGHRVVEPCQCPGEVSNKVTAKPVISNSKAEVIETCRTDDIYNLHRPRSGTSFNNGLISLMMPPETPSQQDWPKGKSDQADLQVGAEAEAAEAAEAEAGGVRGGTSLDGRRITKKRRKLDTPFGLAEYFRHSLVRRHPKQAAGGVNCKGLMPTFRDLLESGVSAASVRAMIDLFMEETTWVGKAPAFRAFLAARARLMAEAERKTQVEERKSLSLEERRLRYMTKAQRRAYYAQKGQESA